MTLVYWEGSQRPKRALPEQALVGTAVNEAVRLSVEHGSRFVEFESAFTPADLTRDASRHSKFGQLLALFLGMSSGGAELYS